MQQKDHDAYTVEMPLGQTQVSRVLSIFSRNDNPKKQTHLDWQYRNTPGSGSYTAFSVSPSGQDAAVYSVFKVKAKVASQIGTVCQSLDTLTDKEHRGKGLFPKLAREVYRRCDEDGIDFVYGFPNSASAPGFFKKLGWRPLGIPPFLFYLNNLLFPIAYFLGKPVFLKNHLFFLYLLVANSFWKTGDIEIIQSADFQTPEYSSLWNKFSERIPVSVWRDSEYMEWRYRRKPDKEYSYLSAYQNGTLVGVLVYTLAEKHRGNVGYIMDLIYDHRCPRAAKALVSEAVLAMSRLGADMVLAWSAPQFPGYFAYRTSLFYKMPRRLQPIKLFFGYRPSAFKERQDIQVSDFYISYADSDTV